jgi:hypothetical protein
MFLSLAFSYGSQAAASRFRFALSRFCFCLVVSWSSTGTFETPGSKAAGADTIDVAPTLYGLIVVGKSGGIWIPNRSQNVAGLISPCKTRLHI